MKDVYLVTGASGFIGANLTRKIIKQGKPVHVILKTIGLNWRLKDIQDKLIIHTCDLRDDSLIRIVDRIKPSVIFHLAAYGSLKKDSDVNKMISVNIKGTINLLNAVKQNSFKLFINTGSSSEYGIKDKPMNENDPVNPINDYGVSKAAQTLFCQKAATADSLPIITFRLFSPYGPYEDKTRLVPNIILDALKNKSINLSSPYFVRDFIYTEDVVTAYLKATEAKIKPGEIFNIGTGKQYTIKEIVDIVMKRTSSKSTIKWRSKLKQKRQIEPRIWHADIKKTKRTLKWEPVYNIENGLKESVVWFKKYNYLYEKY